MKLSASPSWEFVPCTGGAVILEAYSFTVFLFYRTCEVPGTKYETCRFGLLIYRTLQVPAKGAAQAAPLTPLGPSFSCWKKRKQKTIQGDCCPLENPLLGSALAASPGPTAGFLSGNSRCSESALAFFAGLLFPISALYQVRASRPSLRRLARANCARSSAALWNFVPTLGLSGSSDPEMPSHFR